MPPVDPMISLGDLVTQHPELARQLDRWRLDYCCGGRTTLSEACDAAGLDTASVVDALVAATREPAVPDWATYDAVQLVDHIETTHHRYLWEELPRIDALATKVHETHGERHPELADVADCFSALRADLEPHLAKEERVLFPMIRTLATSDTRPDFHCGSLRNPISVMLAEHDTAGELLARLRTLTGDYEPPADACASYVALLGALAELERDTHEHILKENHRLFPMVLDLEQRRAAVLTPS